MADKKIEPCPNCGGSDMWPQRGIAMYKVICYTCGYMSGDKPTEADAIAAHNRVSRANAIADSYAGLFDEVEELFKKWDLDTQIHPEAFLNPLWQAYKGVIEAEDPEGDWKPDAQAELAEELAANRAACNISGDVSGELMEFPDGEVKT